MPDVTHISFRDDAEPAVTHATTYAIEGYHTRGPDTRSLFREEAYSPLYKDLLRDLNDGQYCDWQILRIIRCDEGRDTDITKDVAFHLAEHSWHSMQEPGGDAQQLCLQFEYAFYKDGPRLHREPWRV